MMKYVREDPILRSEQEFHTWGNISKESFESLYQQQIAATAGSTPAYRNLESLLHVKKEDCIIVEEKKALEAVFDLLPWKKENPRTGAYLLSSPSRALRAGKYEAIGRHKERNPAGGPDVAGPIIAGITRPQRKDLGLLLGHALFTGIHPLIETFELDDVFEVEPVCRNIRNAEIYSFSIVNKFMPYIRNIDPEIIYLLTHFSPHKVTHPIFDTDYSLLNEEVAALPYGITLVSFPMKDRKTLSEMPVYELYSLFKSTQTALERICNAYRGKELFLGIPDTQNPEQLQSMRVEHLAEYLFMNIGTYAGGTIPRVHMQAWVNALTYRDISIQRRPHFYLRDEHQERITGTRREHQHLVCANRFWSLFNMPIPSTDYEIKIEPREAKPFRDYDNYELFDLAELLIYNSKVIDQLGAMRDRYVLFYPTGVVTVPFAFHGAMEEGYPMLCTFLSSHAVQEAYMACRGATGKRVTSISQLSFANMYEQPDLPHCREEFQQLLNVESPVYLQYYNSRAVRKVA